MKTTTEIMGVFLKKGNGSRIMRARALEKEC